MFAQESVMDIQELGQFESVYKPSKEVAFCWLRKQYVQLSTEEDHTEIANHANDSLRIWQAAKAHEAEKLKGCVLVPVQCPDPDFADSLFDELSKKAIGEFGDDLLIHFSDIDEEKIWALMVEAAKAQAVPEGFILVKMDDLELLRDSALKIKYASLSNDSDRIFSDIEDIQLSVERLIELQEPAND